MPNEDSFRDIKIQVGYAAIDPTGRKVVTDKSPPAFFRRGALVVLAMVIFLRGRQKAFLSQPPSSPPEQPGALNGSGKAMPKSPKLAKKAKSESTKEETSAIMITDL